MATLIINKPPLATFLPLSKATITRASLHLPISPAVRFSGELGHRKTRGLSVVTRAGPSTSSYVFAFVFPLSLLAVTIFTSLRVDDKLEREFREELAVNEAMREADEEEGDVAIPVEEEPAVPRTRNRPKREA
ncbi:hypothetical protein PVL29_017522 [Vitis rotundifolia]|uniref:High chlorophyll fluorescence 153 n=1 Tax=Vitis rotundifolia TaxID=103349 RepID=A0AA39DIR9_VITRO|nr:hypothetical protein PVL29_017522 [Vitis rotundifolia]